MLVARGGGGSFDVDNVSNASSSKPNYQDDTSNSRTKSNLDQLFIPSLGGGMKLVAQNMHFKASKEPNLLNDYVVLRELSSIAKDIENNNTNGDAPIGSIEEPLATNTTENHHGQRYVYSGLYYIPSWSLRDLPNNKFYSGYYGYAYYFGNQVASTLPVNGVAKYKGTWDFITATQKGKNYELLRNSGGGQAYSRRSATTSDMALEVENNEGREKGLVRKSSMILMPIFIVIDSEVK